MAELFQTVSAQPLQYFLPLLQVECTTPALTESPWKSFEAWRTKEGTRRRPGRGVRARPTLPSSWPPSRLSVGGPAETAGGLRFCEGSGKCLTQRGYIQAEIEM